MEYLSVEEYRQIVYFWELLKKNIEELPKRDAWKDDIHWSEPLNDNEDKIGIKLAADKIQLYIKSGCETKSSEREKQMELYSQKIKEVYSKFDPVDLGSVNAPFEIIEKKGEEEDGRSSKIQRLWVRSDKDQWFAIAQWVKIQIKTLKEIIQQNQ